MKIVKSFAAEFTTFVKEKGVIGLAVGIVIGNAITKFVGQIVTDIVSPIISFVTGAAGNLKSLAYTVPHTQVTFLWGDLIASLIDFLAVMLVVYLVFVKSPIGKLEKSKE